MANKTLKYHHLDWNFRFASTPILPNYKSIRAFGAVNGAGNTLIGVMCTFLHSSGLCSLAVKDWGWPAKTELQQPIRESTRETRFVGINCKVVANCTTLSQLQESTNKTDVWDQSEILIKIKSKVPDWTGEVNIVGRISESWGLNQKYQNVVQEGLTAWVNGVKSCGYTKQSEHKWLVSDVVRVSFIMQSSFDTVTSLVCRLKSVWGWNSDDLRAAAGQLFSGSLIETENLRLNDRFSFALDQRLAFLSSGFDNCSFEFRWKLTRQK